MKTKKPRTTKGDRRLAELLKLCTPDQYADFIASVRYNERRAVFKLTEKKR